ncbi:hypothetical protein ADEAN_000428400 [Angomonas deanei]|uniref:Importin N-terminal domain-containing protein n=1 Tax=Angomonas deanei TaxID=59799 RepID=A0A7G2CAJ8_9TRYP|nr:hypothetical protein ADEAN_000428400 [Angomonas deanei]
MSALANQIIAAVTAATSPDHAVSTQGLHQMMQLQSDPQAFFSASLEVVVSPSASIANRRMVGIQLKNLMKRFPQVAQNAAAQEALCTQVVVDTPRGDS